MKPKSKNMETGRRGEEEAAQWLERRGFRVLVRNWRAGHKEVDLVAASEHALHIVEVKTLTAPLHALPADRVDAAKQARLAAAARRFLAENKLNCEVQFDIISVVIDGDETQVEYIPEAFYPIVGPAGRRL